MAAAAASSPSPDPAAAPPPAASSSNPHRPSAPSAPLRPPAFAAKPLTSPPPNKSALDSANRAAMRALSGPARPHTALDQPMPSAYIRRTSPTVAAATPFVPRPQSALVHVPVRQMQSQPQPQPQSQSQSRPQTQSQSQPPSQPQPQPQIHPKLPVQQAPQPVVPRPAGGGGVPSAPRTIPVRTASKVASFPITSSAPEFNSCKDRERRDDSVVMIHNRKVRLLDGGSGSLYALCRSWIWNGSPQDCQPNFGDGVKLLPRPLPAYSVDSNPSEKNERANDAEDLEKEEHVGSAEQLSTQDLLAGLVKRSKRVRAQFRKERVRRIARYNQRLSLLLPPVEMGRVDAAFGS